MRNINNFAFPVSGVLPSDPLLEDNKALLAPLMAQLQPILSSTISADFT